MQEPPQDPMADGPEDPEVSEPISSPPARVRGRKRRFAKRWSRRFSLLGIGLFAALVVTFFTIDIGQISIAGKSLKSLAESFGSRYLERPMHIGRIVAYPSEGRFAFEDVVIEGPTKDARPFFSAKRIFVNVPWWTMFRKELYIAIDIYDWRMVAEKWPDGNVHLPKLTGKKKKPGDPESKFPLKIKSLDVYCHNGEFVYDDHVAPWRINGPNLEFALVRANNLNTYVGKAEFTNGVVQIQGFEPMAADFSTRFQINGGIVELKHIDLLTDGAESHIDGYVNFAGWPDQEYRIQSTVDFNRMRELFFKKADWRLSGQGRFNGIFKIAKDGKFDLSGLFKSDEAGFGLKNTEWRFGNLDGELQWTSNRFIVKRADSDFLGGRMRLAYALDPLGDKSVGATATLSADYNNVNLYLFTRQFGMTALEPQGRLRGQLSMEWLNSNFSDTMQGRGTSIITAPSGQTIATLDLPADAPPIKPEPQPFQKFRPFGEFALGGNTSYRFTPSTLDFDESWVATPTTHVKFSGHARGGEVNVPFHVTSHDWQNSDRLFTAIMTNFNRPTGAIEVGGRGTFDGKFTRTFSAPRIDGHFEGDRMRAWHSVWGRASGDVVIENSYLNLANGRITYGEAGTIATSGRFALGYPRADGGEEINAVIRAQGLPLEVLRKAFDLADWPVDADLALADLTLRGSYEKPSGSGSMRLEKGVAWGETFEFATSDLRFDGDGSVSLQRVVVAKKEGRVVGDARISWADDTFLVAVSSEGLALQELTTFRMEKLPLTGQLKFTARGYGSFDLPTWEIQDLQVPDLYAADEGVGALRARLRLSNRVMTFDEVAIRSDRLQVSCQGTVRLADLYDTALHCQFDQTSLDPYFKFVASELPFNRAVASGTITANGPLKDLSRLTATARVTDASLQLFDYRLSNDQTIELSFRDNTFSLDRMRFKGDGTQMELHGLADVTKRSLGIQATGEASLAVLQAFYPSIAAEGGAKLAFGLTGTFDAPELTGHADLVDGYIKSGALPGLSQINGRILMSAGKIALDPVDGVTGVLGEGPVLFTGDIILDGYTPSRFDLHASGQSLHMRYPQGLQSTVNIVDLALVGPVTAPVLRGDIDVLRASYRLPFDSRLGYLGLFGGDDTQSLGAGAVDVDVRPASPLTLNVRIRAPSMPFIDNRAANAYIVGSADMNVTGTIDQPVITGRIEIDRGQMMFNGNRYNLLPGSIDFSNPAAFEPFFDVTAESDLRPGGERYHVTIRLTGTFAQFGATLYSEPWLSQTQIIALIMGEAPDVGAVELRNLSSPQDEQARAIASLGTQFILSPITAQVGSAIQKATTLNAALVPMLGTESTLQQLNPTARIVLGRRVSSRVYVTYSRNVSGTQNEIILVEYEQNDKVSWVLSRNEDKTFALDFRIRYVIR